MKKFTLMALLLGLMLALGGCVMNMPEAFLKESADIKVPDISGHYTPGTGDQTESFDLKRVKGANNAFVAVPKSDPKAALTITMEPLASDGLYLVQIKNPKGPEVVLTLCLMKDKKITSLLLDVGDNKDDNITAVKKLAEEHGLTLDEKRPSLITKYESADKVKAFFDACFTKGLVVDNFTVTVK